MLHGFHRLDAAIREFLQCSQVSHHTMTTTIMSGNQIIHSSLRRVARSHIPIYQQCRTFTSSQYNRAAQGGQGTARGQITRQMGKEKTMQSRISKARGSEIPTDLGYFPETLIKPESKNLPSLLSAKFARRLRIEWTAYLQRARDFIG